MARYLVTGGAGFIGSNLAHALSAPGEGVRILGNFSTGRRDNIEELLSNPRVELFEGSITDPPLCARATRGVDYVLHQAAIPSVPRSIEAPVETNLTNVHGSLVLLEACRASQVK